MKKITLVLGLFIIILLASSCRNKNEKGGKTNNDIVKLEMKGSIKSLIETEYEAKEKFGEASKGIVNNYNFYLFNKKGNITQDSSYVRYIDGNLKSKSIYIYDTDGRLIEKNVASIETKSNKTSTGLSGRYSYVYNKKGELFEVNKYNFDSSFQSKDKYKYDVHGNTIEHDIYNMAGSLVTKYTYKYDDDGNMIEKKIFLKNNQALTTNNKYNDNGQLIESSNSFFGGVSKYEYDEKGFEIKITESGKDIRVFTTKYKLDSYNNWILKTSYLNDVPTQIFEREIKYY